MEDRHVLGSAMPPILRGRGTTIPKIIGTLYMLRTRGMRNSNQLLHDDQTILEKKFLLLMFLK